MTFSLRDFCEPGDEYVDYAAGTREVITETGSFGIKYDPEGDIECGECGMTWADDITPAGRCPWEYDH